MSVSADDLRARFEREGVDYVMVAVTDLDGIIRGKHVSAEKFLSIAESSFGFCDVVLGWDSNDVVYENTTLTGWHHGFPDAQVAVALDTERRLPGERPSYLYLGDFVGRLEASCPRSVLKRVLARCGEMGHVARAAFEYEFFVFEETPHGARAKGYRDLRPITPGGFGYSVLRSTVWRDLYDEILSTCQELNMPLEGLHEESGAGVLEAAITVSDALEAADRAALFKTFVKSLCQRRGLMATFMSRWSVDWPGQSGHIHVSLKDAFHDPADPAGMSSSMRSFVGGQVALMPELLAMVAPTVNSYSRLVPGYWAPTSATWGIENRTTALRVIPGSPKSQRAEYRVAGADANPYLALSAALGSGLWGMEQGCSLGDPVQGNAYEDDAGAARLPSSLGEAASRLRASSAAAEVFGEDFVSHFAASREWEEQQFRASVTNWELERYFEAI